MLPLTIEITDQNGIQWRPPFRNLKFAKTFYGGEDLWMAFVLDRDGSQDYPDVGYGYDVELRNGLAPRFAGEIRQIESDLETVTVKVLGQFVYLDDYNYRGQGMLWSDSRYGKWRPITFRMNTAFWPEKWRMDNQHRLFLAPQRGELFDFATYYGGYFYYSPHDDIVRVSFDYEFIDTDAAVWWVRLGSNESTPDFWGPVPNSEWLESSPASGVKDITLDTPRPFIWFEVYCQSGMTRFTGETGGTVRFTISNLRVWGERGFSSRAIETPSVIHVAESMIRTVPPTSDFDLVRDSLFVRDTFTAANGTSLDAHGPDIDKERGGWTEDAGNWDIQGNEANVVAITALAQIDAGVSDGIATCDITTEASGTENLGLLFRYLNLNNFWMWKIEPHTGDAVLHHIVGGAWQAESYRLSLGIEHGYTYNLMVKLRGDRMDLHIGGIWRCGLNSTTFQTETRYGMRASGADAVNARFDNFEVFQALPLWPLFYERGQSWHKALKDASSYGDWDFRALGWGIESGGHRLYLKRAERDRVRYVIPPHHASRLSAKGQTDKDFVTEAWGQYIDEDGVERWTDKYYAHITPTGIVANTTATGDDLASTIYGVFRDRAINFGRVDANLAVEYLGQYLEEHAHPQVKSSFEIFGPVQDRFKGGAWIQPYELEMGYLVQIPHFRAVEVDGLADSDIRWDVGGGSDTTFLLVAMQYDAERGKAKLIPEGASEDLERLMKYSRDVERGQEKSLIDKRREASFSR